MILQSSPVIACAFLMKSISARSTENEIAGQILIIGICLNNFKCINGFQNDIPGDEPAADRIITPMGRYLFIRSLSLKW